MVLNDVGPQLADAAIQRIRSYAGSPPAFAKVTELEQYFRSVYKPYGAMSDAQWRRLTETSIRRLPDGRVTPHYDPAMVMQFTHHDDDYALWDAWDSLDLPVLCLRGEHSDLLLPEVADAMRNRGPRAVVVTIAGCGHAPTLNTPEQYALIERFFAA
jgi:pimeloyl-ACP methyl ester carboxylesterase